MLINACTGCRPIEAAYLSCITTIEDNIAPKRELEDDCLYTVFAPKHVTKTDDDYTWYIKEHDTEVVEWIKLIPESADLYKCMRQPLYYTFKATMKALNIKEKYSMRSVRKNYGTKWI